VHIPIPHDELQCFDETTSDVQKTHSISWQDLIRAKEFRDALKFKCAAYLKIPFTYLFLNFLMVLTIFHIA
jgi:hypothetical protein